MEHTLYGEWGLGGGGAQNGRGGGEHVRLLPLQKGREAGKVLAMLKGGLMVTTFFGIVFT